MESSPRRYSKNYDHLFKIILIGDSGVGKTSILASFVGEEVVKSHISTIGIDFKMKCLDIDGKQVKIQVWDTAGQERYETITTQYYRRAQGIVLAYDITRKESFNNIRKWLRYVEEFAERDVKLTLIGNKSDLKDSRHVSTEEAEADCSLEGHLWMTASDYVMQLAQEYGIPWFETSAYTGEHVEDAFLCITKQIYVAVLQHEEEIGASQDVDVKNQNERLKRVANNIVITSAVVEEEEEEKSEKCGC